MLKLGGTDINQLFLGSTEINKAYLGSNVIFEKVSFAIEESAILGWWEPRESATSIADKTDNDRIMNLTGSPSFVTDGPTNLPNGVTFGTGKHGRVSFDYDSTEGFMSAWVKISNFAPLGSNAVYIMALGTRANPGEGHLGTGVSSSFLYQARYYSFSRSAQLTGNSTGTLYHLCATRDTNAIKLYVNGSLVATDAHNFGVASGDTGSHLSFGTDSSSVYNMEGNIYQAIVGNRVLTADEVAQLYNGGSGVNYYSVYGVFKDVANTSLSTNLAAFWELDEASGTRVDSTGTHSLSDNGTVTNELSKIGNGAVFNAANIEYLGGIDHSDFDIIASNTNITMAFWIKTTAGATNPSPCGKWFSNARNWLVRVESTGKIRFFVGNGASSTGANVQSTTTINDGAWHLIVITFSASDNKARIYVDGTLDATSGIMAPAASTAKFGIGAENGDGTQNSSDTFTGTLDQFGWWKKVLSSDEISLLWNGGSGIPYSES